VFHVEYVVGTSQGAAKKSQVCSDPSRIGFSTLIKMLDLAPGASRARERARGAALVATTIEDEPFAIMGPARLDPRGAAPGACATLDARGSRSCRRGGPGRSRLGLLGRRERLRAVGYWLVAIGQWPTANSRHFSCGGTTTSLIGSTPSPAGYP
jgi:hypothetical protein